jgi:hypothetical protein
MKNTDSVSMAPTGFTERPQQPENKGFREASYAAHAANMRKVMYSATGIIFSFTLFLMVDGYFKAIASWLGMDVGRMDESSLTITLLCFQVPFLLGFVVSGIVLCRAMTEAKGITSVVQSKSNN